MSKQSLGWVVGLVLLANLVGCAYNRHTNMGNTEKWVASDVHILPKCLVLIVLPAIDSVISPFTAT
jgi:hypothetical protein